MSIRFSSVRPLLLVSLAGLLTLPAATRAGETLTMKFRAGETYAYRITQNMTMSGEAQGQKFGSEMSQTLFVRTHVKSVAEDGSAKAEQTIDRVQMKMVTTEPVSQTIEYDTNDEEEPSNPIAKQMAENLTKMVGEAISMTISPQGRMKDVVLPEALKPSEPAAGANPGGSDQLKQMLEQSGLRLDDGEVSVGDSWEHEMELDAPPFGTMQITTTYTYNGKNDDGLHKIDAAMDVHLEPVENAPVKVTAEAKEASGSYLFDNETGKLQQATIKQVLEMDIGGLAKQNITTHVTMTLSDGTD